MSQYSNSVAASRGTAIAADSPASSGQAVVQSDAHALPALSYTLSSTTTPMGHRSHVVTTRNHELVQELFAHAHSVDIEPYQTRKRGLWRVEFICDDGECALTIEAAKASATKGVFTC